mmetsp:Transcript_14678/g.25376  ORF Transcript_14678/g.25376 Transcript_14678/m.25376 type:complete len:210 (+) Transcript_14678:466-1095(+)
MLVILLRDVLICSCQDGANQIKERSAKRPRLVHFLQDLALTSVKRGLDGITQAQPHRQMESGLRPRKDPRNGSQRLHTTLSSLLRTRSNVQQAQLELWGGIAEVFDKQGVVMNNFSIFLAGNTTHFFHDFSPLRLNGGLVNKVRFQDGRRIRLQSLDRKTRQTKVLLDHLTLNGHAQTAVNGIRRLRQNGKMLRTASTTNGSTATMEER